MSVVMKQVYINLSLTSSSGSCKKLPFSTLQGLYDSCLFLYLTTLRATNTIMATMTSRSNRIPMLTPTAIPRVAVSGPGCSTTGSSQVEPVYPVSHAQV